MSRLLTNRRLFILLASFILLTAIAGLTLRGSGRGATWPERAIMDTENAIGGLFYRPVSAVTGFLQGIHDLHQMYVENAQLKSELQNYSALKVELQSAQAQNAQLNKMLGFKQTGGKSMPLVPAHVVGRDPSKWNSDITIDVGHANGVHTNMAVISTDGSLVGRVAQAAQYSSKVTLITDTQVGDGVSAMVQNGTATQPYGIVVGSTTESGSLEMQFLSPVAQLNPGQSVVTSGLSDVYPKGLLIGTVVSVKTGQQGLTKSAVIHPAADLNYLEDVFVVTSQGVK
ncbi:rod shape-determining protein MreC [Alicyclobacillus tolerans]|uniref:rod shape-determining protein MreC n=1 Tax=Alicyclobacillus tolerans TaxID=90970 RepID=UPI001F01FB95|nr:rod shape-determining protein MreC [Alicyclobacillus tolerans]MCF8563554.1 rod shape-determining protein MreC [Alicyclobacillus tolerans]